MRLNRCSLFVSSTNLFNQFFFFSVFHPIPETGEDGREDEKSEGKNDNNNNAETDNMNTTKSTTQARYDISLIKVF